MKQAKEFAKRSLKCKPFKVNWLAQKEEYRAQLDQGIYQLVQDVIIQKEAKDPNLVAKIKEIERLPFFKQKYENFKKLKMYDKIFYFYRILVVI